MAENPLLDLERELVAAAVRQAMPAGAGRLRSRRRLLAVVLLGLLLMAAAALAAVSLLKTGRPVPYRFGEPAKANSGYGAPTSARLIGPISDPGGGLPWGLRVVRTSRGYGCVQVGHLYEGRLGVVGEHGVFHDDGLFHELPADHLSTRARCVPLDRTGHAYVVEHSVLGINGAPMCFEDRKHDRFCRDELTRTVDFGLLGPDATRLTYRAVGEPPRTLTPGPAGAFLIVLPRQPLRSIRTPGGHVVNDGLLLTATPASYVTWKVRYRDGSVCVVKPTREFEGGCPGHGPIAPRVRMPSRSRLRTPLHLSITGRGARAVLHVGFRARVAARGSRSDYHLRVTREHPVRDPGKLLTLDCTGGQSSPVGRDVAAGDPVRIDVALRQYCPGAYLVRLEYRVERGDLGPRGPTSSYPGRLVDERRIVVP